MPEEYTLSDVQRKEAYTLLTAALCRMRVRSADKRFTQELSDALHNLPMILLNDTEGKLCAIDMVYFNAAIHDAKKLLRPHNTYAGNELPAMSSAPTQRDKP